jgi:hypothetical protein
MCRGDRHQLHVCIFQEFDLLQTSVKPEIDLCSYDGDLFITIF